MKVFLRLIVIGAVLWTARSSVFASDEATQVTIDLPVPANQALPAWLGRPVASGNVFAALDVAIAPRDPEASLLVTVFYQETNGGFLRISWQDGTTPPSPDALPGPGEVGASSVLCDNFYEGIGMNNQRTLLVTSDTMKHAGALHFQVGGTTLGISRIKLEWLGKSTGLASPEIADMLVTAASGTTELASSLAGTPPAAVEAVWRDRIVNVPVTDAPLRVEQGVDFTVRLDGPPVRARLALKESGLPPGQHLVVWLNNKRAGIVMPAVLDLADAGYSSDVTDAPYVGWREGTFLVPKDNLISGDNVLQFSAEADYAPGTAPDGNIASAPLAIKEVKLQFQYPPSPVVTDGGASTAPVTSPSSTPESLPASADAVAPSAVTLTTFPNNTIP